MLLLGIARPELPLPARSALTVGERDTALLDLYADAFGARLEARTECPRCATSLEFDVDASHIRALPPADRPLTHRFVHGGTSVEFRLPNAGDLAVVARDADAPPDRQPLSHRLMARCIVAVERDDAGSATRAPSPVEPGIAGRASSTEGHDGRRTDASVLPEALFGPLEAAIARTAAAMDPQAETTLAMACPDCGHRWEAPFDIVTFLWQRLDAWAGRLLSEVHALAVAYGWSERDILALSPRRRRHYLDLAGS